MKNNHIHSRFVVLSLALLLVAMLAASLAMPQVAFAKNGGDLPRHEGWVTVKPAAGFVGTWVVGGKTFTVTSATQIDQVEGKLVVGACAKVKYQVVGSQNRAIEVDSEPARDCR